MLIHKKFISTLESDRDHCGEVTRSIKYIYNDCFTR